MLTSNKTKTVTITLTISTAHLLSGITRHVSASPAEPAPVVQPG